MRIRDIMTRKVITVTMDDTLATVNDIFDSCRFHHLVVMEGEKIVGVISDRDLLEHLSPFIGRPLMERSQDVNTLRRRVHQVMRRKPVVVHQDSTVDEAARRLLERRVGCLPVVDDRNALVGIVTWRDLLINCSFCRGSACNDAA